MAVGGPFIFIPSFHLANTFPRHSGLILSLLTGAFDSSSAVFLVYRLLYQRFGVITLKQWFLGYLVVPLFIFVVQILVMPMQSYKTASELAQQAEVEQGIMEHENVFMGGEDEAGAWERRIRRESVLNEIEELLGGPPEELKHVKTADQKRGYSGVWGVMHGKSVTSQLGSFWFLGITAVTIIQMTRINYFVATIRPQYEFLLHSYPASVAINGFFDIALPLGGLAAIPFIGVVLDTVSTLTVLIILVTCAAAIGTLGLIENSYAAAYLNILLFVAYRPFYYTVVSDYCAKVFGVATFGKVYGAVICLAGLFNFSQAGLDAITYRLCGGDPRPANGVLLVAAVVVGAALVVFVWRRGKKAARRRRLGEQAQRARGQEQRLWPDGESVGGYGAA